MRSTIWIAILAFGCTRANPPPATKDRDGAGTELGAACATLRRFQCPEGSPNDAGRTCFETQTVAMQYAPFPSACIVASGSVIDIRACGDRNTIRVRCVP
jgi:hypothetical protein